MTWFWIGFFVFVATLLALDLGLLHKDDKPTTFKSALGWTVAWMALGLSFSGFVYLMYDNHWLGAQMLDEQGRPAGGGVAVSAYLSGYLLEQALSIDNIFVISMIFRSFRVPEKYQHRVLFWGIIGAVVFRVAMLAGGVWLVQKFDWVFYIFGAYLAYAGLKIFFHKEDDEENHPEKSLVVRILRRFIRIVDGDHGGKFMVRDDHVGPRTGARHGRRALTMLAVTLIVVELTDVVFALDSIPAVLSVTSVTFLVVTSNIFAIMGLRSLYFVLAGAMAQFQYLKLALGVLLVLIGGKMVAHDWYHMPHWLSLALIAGIISVGVGASIFANRKTGAATDAPSNAGAAPATDVKPEA